MPFVFKKILIAEATFSRHIYYTANVRPSFLSQATRAEQIQKERSYSRKSWHAKSLYSKKQPLSAWYIKIPLIFLCSAILYFQ